MKIVHLQMLLAKMGFYTGRIDGIAGSRTWVGIKKADSLIPFSTAKWSKRRRMIAAGQAILNALGYDAGQIDGYSGHNTQAAMRAYLHKYETGKPLEIDRPVSQAAFGKQNDWPRQKDVPEFFGPAGSPRCTAGKVDLPIPFRIAWNKRQKIRRFSCHELVAVPMTAIFENAVRHYGEKEYRRLELDLFGGCYNYRKMRGGRSLSMHAYGIATDLNPEKNQLRWGADRAQFAQPEYQPFWKIVMDQGGVPAGYAWGKDWMHFQFARL